MLENNEKLIDMLAGGALYSTYAKEKAEKAEKAHAVKEKKEDGKAAGNDEFQVTSAGGQRRTAGGTGKKGDTSRGGQSKRGGRGGNQ